MNGYNSWFRYVLPFGMLHQYAFRDYDKPNGTSQKTIRKRARYIRSQHQKRK